MKPYIYTVAIIFALALSMSVLSVAYVHAQDASSTPGTSIITGAAVSNASTTNMVNSNIINNIASTTIATTTQVIATTTQAIASTTPNIATTTPNIGNTVDNIASSTASTTAVIINTASTTNTTTSSANTGDNTANTGGSGTAHIDTGNAYASATSINIINTNIVNSNGLFMFKNLFSGMGIDLRSLNLSYFLGNHGNQFRDNTASTSCLLPSCNDNLNVSATNIATTSNAVIVRASTGGNTTNTSEGTTTINTGNAYASGNAINMVNSNIIRSNYLLVGINSFGNMNNGITLPGADFFAKLLARNQSLSASTSVTSNNVATVTSSTTASASTGNNVAGAADGTNTITTGSAISSATTYNQVNTNEIGGTKIFFLFRIWGNWNGTVRGLPNGVTWKQTSNGIELFNADNILNVASSTSTTTDGVLNVASSTSSTTDDVSNGSSSGSLTASTTNTASVTNNVSVYALTGNNEANITNGNSTIRTGNAYASANTVNIVNTNLIGHNWIYAIFNVFGNLNGDISFGHPDLWVGVTASTTNPTLPGSDITFHITVSNRGDADATNVQLSTSFLQNMLHFATGATTTDSDMWNVGTISTGATKEFVYHAQAGAVSAGNSVAVPVTVTATSDEKDNNPADNTDNLTVVIMNPAIIYGGGGSGVSPTSDSKLSVTKTANTNSTTTPATINYVVSIINSGGPAYHSIATDTLISPTGTVVQTQSWNLGTIKYHDKIKITYSVAFEKGAPSGTYKNTITVTGINNYENAPAWPVALTPVSAEYSLVLLPVKAKIKNMCKKYLTTYIKQGADNNTDEVLKLQMFLHKEEADNGISINGIYDAATIAAVKRFQAHFANEILAPWGYYKPTGYVYYTTQKEINNIVCNGKRIFNLTAGQQNEITMTRRIIANMRNVHIIIQRAHHTINLSATTTTATTSFTLPPGLKVGMATHQDTSWVDKLLGGAQSLMANMLGALTGTFWTNL